MKKDGTEKNDRRTGELKKKKKKCYESKKKVPENKSYH